MNKTYSKTNDYLENAAVTAESNTFKSHSGRKRIARKVPTIYGFKISNGVVTPILVNPKG